MEIIELRRGDFIYRGAAGRGMGVFTRCPICEFCNREGIGEIMYALCATDEVMFRLQHGKLHRGHTIARGEGVCDYWIVGNKVKDAR